MVLQEHLYAGCIYRVDLQQTQWIARSAGICTYSDEIGARGKQLLYMYGVCLHADLLPQKRTRFLGIIYLIKTIQCPD